MGISKNKKAEKPEALDLTFNVRRAKDFTKDGQDGCCIGFDMDVNNVTIYGCFYREGHTKKGDEYALVSFPSQKSGDKYYNHAYVRLSDEQIEEIAKQIEKVLEA